MGQGAAAVTRVAQREAELIAVARALVTPDAYPNIEATLTSAFEVKKIGPSAMRILHDTLAKGVVKTLARLGGARPRLRPGSASRPARVFEVRQAPKLAFSPYTYRLLTWLTNTPLHSKGERATFDEKSRTLADEIVAYLTLRLVEGRRLERVVAHAPGLRTGLTWLAFARPLIRYGGGDAPPPFDGLLATPDRQTVVECLAADLSRRWVASASWEEHDLLDAEDAVRIGTVERAVLQSFLDVVDKAGRWDLATFLLDAAVRVLPRGVSARDLAARASPPVRTEGVTLRVRTEARRRSGALFHALGRLGKKRDELALVRFIDDGYEAAQATLSSWETLPRDGFTRAESVVTALDALDTTTVPEASASA